MLIAIVTPGVGFTFEQLKTLPLQKEDIMAACGNIGESQTNAAKNSIIRAKNSGNKNVAAYCIWKNQEQIEGGLSEAVGFEKELNEIFGILGRKTKANILIMGESGVGKTTLVHALVQAIVADRVPTFLQGAQVYELDTIALSIGVSYKSEIESRMKKILDELSNMDNAILVIESFDQLMDKQGALNGTINLLKASLNQGLLCVCTSSVEGFTKNIEVDKEITGKFERIIIEEPSVESTEIILQTVIKSFEEFHKLKASEDLLINAIRLAKRYFSEKHLPESAIDLVDRTMALLKIKNDLHSGERKEIVGVEHLKEVVSQKTGIPLGDVQTAERERLINADKILKKRVVGQDHAIKAVLDSIYESRSGLNKKGQPIGSFFFWGQPELGKLSWQNLWRNFCFRMKQQFCVLICPNTKKNIL